MRDHYTYRVSWSDEDSEYVGTCAEFASLSHLAGDQVAALRGIRDLVRDVVVDLQANGEPVPEPMADATYSGKFMVRVPPELHKRLSIDAAEAGVSLNRLVNLRLSLVAQPSTTQAKRGEPETVFLLSSPKNAERLTRSVRQAKAAR